MSCAERRHHLKRLKEIAPTALLFTVMANSDSETDSAGSDTDTADEGADLPPTVPTLVTSLQQDGSVTDEILRHVLSYKALPHQRSLLQSRSTSQAQSAIWAAHRIGRITASVAHSVLAFDGIKVPNATVSDIVTGGTGFTNEAIAWGVKYEKKAIEMFTEAFQNAHQDAKITPAGLFICDDLFILGASPDALVECSCCGQAVVEVKTSFKYRMCDVAGLTSAAAADSSFCLDTNLQLKSSHKYYTQVQCQMGVTGRHSCQFVLYTTNAILVQNIPYNPTVFGRVKTNSTALFRQSIFPKLLH